MDDNFFINRVKSVLDNNIPNICGIGCPSVCCDPIIIGNTLLKDEIRNIDEFTEKINKYIKDFLKENNNLFEFEGLLLAEINTDNDNFISEEEIKKMVIAKLKNNNDENVIKKYINQIKEKYKEKFLSVIIAFSCPKYDRYNRKCLIHEYRPQICRQYKCEQLEPKKVSYDFNNLLKRIKIHYNERNFIKKNISKNFVIAIDKYLNNKYE